MRWLRYKCQITIDPHKKDIETLRVKRIYYIEVKKYIFDDSYAAPDNSSKKKSHRSTLCDILNQKENDVKGCYRALGN